MFQIIAKSIRDLLDLEEPNWNKSISLPPRSDLGRIFPFFLSPIKHGPPQANLVLIAYASSKGSGEPAHSCSLARTSAARSYKQ